jgi:hypothetical protein
MVRVPQHRNVDDMTDVLRQFDNLVMCLGALNVNRLQVIADQSDHLLLSGLRSLNESGHVFLLSSSEQYYSIKGDVNIATMPSASSSR